MMQTNEQSSQWKREEQSQEHAYKKFILTGQTINFAYYSDVLWRLLENV
jgi:hypothetical protein